MARYVKFNIPELIEEYLFTKNDNDTEGCQEIKTRFEDFYEKCNESLRASMRGYVSNFLTNKKIDHDKDLDGLFVKLL